MTTGHRATMADLMAQPDDDNLYELVRGEIVSMPPPKEDHGYIEAALVEAIGRYLHDRAVSLGWTKGQGRLARDRLVGRLVSGDAGVRFTLPNDPEQLRGLDVCYLTPEQVARLGDLAQSEYMAEMPALVAEIISPSETATYINEKVADLLGGGARLIWLLFPKTRTVAIYRPDGTWTMTPAGGALDGETILPGFTEDLAAIFP